MNNFTKLFITAVVLVFLSGVFFQVALADNSHNNNNNNNNNQNNQNDNHDNHNDDNHNNDHHDNHDDDKKVTPTPTPVLDCDGDTDGSTPNEDDAECVTPTVTPTPTAVVTPIPTNTPSNGGNGGGPGDGLGCAVHDCSGNQVGGPSSAGAVLGASTGPEQAVLSASTFAGTGTFENTLMDIMLVVGMIVLSLGGLSYAKEKSK